jgi:hypothetical protein
MIISFSRRFIYLKTRKTAGTSTETVLREICSDQDILTSFKPKEQSLSSRGKGQGYVHNRSTWPVWDRILWRLGDRTVVERPSRAFQRHATAAEIERRYPDEIKSFLKIGNVRNPFDRQVSLYFWRTRKMQVRPSFDEWMNSTPSPILDDWEIVSLNNRCVLDVVIRYETLQDDMQKLADRLGIPLSSLPFVKSGHRPKVHYRDFFGPTTRAMAEKWYSNELSEFAYTF